MLSENLYESFTDLAASPSAGVLNARRIPGRSRDFIAKGASGQPIILLSVSASSGYRPAIALRYVSVESAVTCRVRDESGQVEGLFVVISCSLDSPDLFEAFISTCSSAIQTLTDDPSIEDVDRQLRKLVDLFSRLGKTGSRQIKGLWSELLVIANSVSTSTLVEAWHVDSNDLFDFSKGNIRIEIKSTELQQRVHDFSADQIFAKANERIFVVSVLLRKNASGVGVVGLARRICGRLDKRPDLKSKVWGLVIETLGNEFSERLDIKFDEAYALASMRVYRASEIPQVPRPVPNAVFDIRFSSNVSEVTPIYDLGLDPLISLFEGT